MLLDQERPVRNVLMNEVPPEVRVSTPMTERPVKIMKILTVDGLKWRRLRPADQKEILAKYMVNIPAEAEEASDKALAMGLTPLKDFKFSQV